MTVKTLILFVVLHLLNTISNIRTQVDPDLEIDQGGRLRSSDFLNAEEERFARLPHTAESNNINDSNIF